MNTYEKIVKGATKVKVAAPKPKYIEPLLMATLATHESSDNLSTIMRFLDRRLQDLSWLVVYKALIVVHIMIREGDKDVVLGYLNDIAQGMLNLAYSNIAKNAGFHSEVRYIMMYSRYLQVRVKNFGHTKVDYVRDERLSNSVGHGGGRLRTLTVEKGLLRECESVQKQIDALLKNAFLESDIKNDVVLTAFRLLVNDLLALFQQLNEGVINLLEHYFEMLHDDAARALDVYKKFVDQTKYVIDYLRVAKHLEYATKLHVPTIKHAPTALTSSLLEYLNDPQFEKHREEYLLKKGTAMNSDKTKKGAVNGAKAVKAEGAGNTVTSPNFAVSLNQTTQLGPTTTQKPQEGLNRSNTLLVTQTTHNPWGSAIPAVVAQNLMQQGIVPVFTGIGFRGYGVQDQLQMQQIQQQQMQKMQQQTQQMQQQQMPQLQQAQLQQAQQQSQQMQQIQPQLTVNTTGNPFLAQQTGTQSAPPLQNRNSFGPSDFNTSTGNIVQLQRNNTNPFSQLQPMHTATGKAISNPFGATRFSNNGTTAYTFAHQNREKLDVTATGSNPFKVLQTTRNVFNSYKPAAQPNFKPQPTAGGLENLPTIPVFPQTQQAQMHNAYVAITNANLVNQATGQMRLQYQQQLQQQQLQQQQLQQQQLQQQLQQQHQPLYGTYNGPSLI